MKVKFKNWKCDLRFARYDNGALALRLIDAEDGEPVATCTVNLYKGSGATRLSTDLPAHTVYIKGYSENEGMEAALIRYGVIEREPVHGMASMFGWVSADAYRLTPKAIKAMREWQLAGFDPAYPRAAETG